MSVVDALQAEIFEGKVALQKVLNASNKEWNIEDLRKTASGERKAGVMALALLQLQLENVIEIDHKRKVVRKL